MRHTTTVISASSRLLLSASALALIAAAPVLQAQTPVPMRELSAPEAKTTEVFGNIFNVRPLTDGRVLVNDGMRRQLVALDQNFGTRKVLIDSISAGGQSYGPRAAPIIPYLGDSSLFVDGTSLSLLVIDPTGKVARVMSAPKPGDLRFLNGSQSGTDGAGNLVYRSAMVINANRQMNAQPGQPMAPVQPPDSAPIVRANFETRTVDTLGRVKVQSGTRANMTQGADGKMQVKITINPLITVDEWAVLSDGTVAFVRGHDYHVDMIKPDGKTFSTAKLPFDWKRLTDEDKQALIDSTKAAQDKAAADNKAAGVNNPMAAMERMATVAGMAGGGGGGTMTIEIHRDAGGGGGGGGRGDIAIGGPGGPPGAFQMPTTTFDFVPLKEIADYWPAIRQGAAKADLDGNLWVLPTTSAQSKAGELIYDVINNRGELFQRVRLPVGRSIAGFGHDGIVYLMYRDGTVGWQLERTKILSGARAAR